eukprot:scaffold78515_cov46-Attheya_sp.AAC.3
MIAIAAMCVIAGGSLRRLLSLFGYFFVAVDGPLRHRQTSKQTSKRDPTIVCTSTNCTYRHAVRIPKPTPRKVRLLPCCLSVAIDNR